MSDTSEMIRTKFGETDTKRDAGLETSEDVAVITAVEKIRASCFSALARIFLSRVIITSLQRPSQSSLPRPDTCERLAPAQENTRSGVALTSYCATVPSRSCKRAPFTFPKKKLVRYRRDRTCETSL